MERKTTMERLSYMELIAEELRRFNPNSEILRLWEVKPVTRYTERDESEKPTDSAT